MSNLTSESASERSLWTFHGRIGRAEYFAVWALTSIVGLLLSLLIKHDIDRGIATVLGFAGLAASVYLQLVAAAKRLHDMGQSAWWLLLVLVPLVNVALGISLIVWRGEKSLNRWGAAAGLDEAQRLPVAADAPAEFHSESDELLKSRETPERVPMPQRSQVSQNSADYLESYDSEQLWANALAELDGPNLRAGLWARVFSEAGGKENEARAAYLAKRVDQMKIAVQKQIEAKARAEEDAVRARWEAAGELALQSWERASHPKAQCPNCDGLVGLNDKLCPHCDAFFGPGSAWSPKRLTAVQERAHSIGWRAQFEEVMRQLAESGFELLPMDDGAVLDRIKNAGHLVQSGTADCWRIRRSGIDVAYAFSRLDLLALAALARERRPLSRWISA